MMEFLSQHILEMDGHYMTLLQVLAVLVYLINLPYAGMVIGTLALSMFLSFRDREIPDSRFARLAGDLIETFLGNTTAMLVLGICPLLALPLIYAQWFAGLEATPLPYIPFAILLVIIGYVMVARYRASYAKRRDEFGWHIFLGNAAGAMLTLSYFVLLAAVGRLHDPEKWFRVKNLLIMLLNWNVIWKWLFFMHAALAVTGAAMLFFFLGLKRDETMRDPEYASFVRKWGGGVSLAFTLALPVFYLFYIFTTPDVAFNNAVYLMATLVPAVAMLIALLLLGVLTSPIPRFGGAIFSLFMVFFVLAGSVDLLAMNQANREHYRTVERTAEEHKAAREAELHARLEGGAGAGAGEQVFQTVCSACHKMDSRLVGPPLNDVLPKYTTVDVLTGFILNPAKVNPEYPPMPNPGLSPQQARAVAEYLLGAEAEGSSQSGH